MKKFYILLLLAIGATSFGQTFYSENMGTPAGTTLISANVFQNSAPIVYTGTGDVRSTAVSTGYNGASGGGNVFLNAATEYFQIDGLNSSAYNTADLQLSFGINTPTAVTNVLTVEVSTNGTTWTPVTYTPTGTGWTLATIAGGVIPSSATLSIRFSSATALQYRLDDVKLSSVSASCTLALGTGTAVCNAFTAGTDTYTATIPYTGGGNATYTLTPNAGVVTGGDNPSTVAAGNILVIVPEGTNLVLTITGGTCNLSANVNSPECKPVNALPYHDAFDYPEASSLGAQVMWTNVNSGDNIIMEGGASLSYPNYTSTGGNAALFSGAGIDCFSPFTPTTSGTLYSSFLLNINDMTNVTADLSETYFAAFADALKNYKARIFFKKNGTQYQLGMDAASTTTNYDPTLRNIGDTVFVVMGYDFGTNTISAWFSPNLTTFSAATPATLTSTPTAAITELGGFLLRQDDNAKTPNTRIDDLRVATTIAGLLAVQQNEKIAGLKVYPNPVTNGNLFITSDSNAAKQVVVYDILGKQVINATVTNQPLNVSNLNSGVYMVKITESGKTATRKLVIQ